MTNSLITRESILDGSIRRLAETAGDGATLMTDQERATTVETMLANAPSRDSIWLFAYGSLIWNPAIHYSEKKPGTIYGYHRRFCLWSTIGRGSPEQPGLMLGLKYGGCCRGLVYRIDPEKIHTELDIVFRRELITSAYRPTWVKTYVPGDTWVNAIAFVIDHNHERYSGPLDDDTIIRTIASASGTLGTCSDYLFSTTLHLDKLGMPDSHLNTIARGVRHRQQTSGN